MHDLVHNNIKFYNLSGFTASFAISKCGLIYSYFKKDIKLTQIDRGGYVTIGMRKCGDLVKSRIPVHRLVASRFIPNLENKPQVNHLDGDKFNNAVSNLEWCTAEENNAHAYSIGLKVFARNKPRRLTVEDKRFVVRQRMEGASFRRLGSMLGISDTALSHFMRKLSDEELSSYVV